jgi:hypothetical protein
VQDSSVAVDQDLSVSKSSWTCSEELKVVKRSNTCRRIYIPAIFEGGKKCQGKTIAESGIGTDIRGLGVNRSRLSP